MKDKRIIILGGNSISTNIVFNYLDNKYGIFLTIIEEKEPLNIFLKRRIKRLGLLTVLGQIIFQVVVVKILSLFSKKRIAEIIKKNNLNTNSIPASKIEKVDSINSAKTIELIKNHSPDLIIINGTRILSTKILQCTDCSFINTHAGITPLYRGVHGMYWALVNNDPLNSGVTVHYVDKGIDTGNIIEQQIVKPTERDNFVTYPLLQISVGIELLADVVHRFFNETIKIKSNPGTSKLYYHPTVGQYIYYRIVRKVK